MASLPVESLLRPAVELWSAIASAACAGALLMAPGAMMMPRDVAAVGAALFAAWALKRYRDARRVLRYRRNLRRLEHYELRPEQIPVSHHKLFLGRGFPWTQLHTQRLQQTRDPALQRFLAQPALYRWARRAEIRYEHSRYLGWLPALTRRAAWWNPVPPLPAVGGNPAIHGIEPDEDEVWMDLGERVGHTLVLGTTRVGKTRLCELLVTQDIRRGEVVIVFDPKGDAELLKRMYAEAVRCGRDKDFLFFHLGYPEISARYNPIGSFGRPTEPATRIADQLPGEGDSAAFRQFAWRFTNIVVRALITLGRRPDYAQIARHVTSIEPLLIEYAEHWLGRHGPKDWERDVMRIEAEYSDPKKLPPKLKDRDLRALALVRYVRDQAIYDPVLDGLRNAWEYDTTYYGKITASLLPLLEKLTTGQTAGLIVPDYANPDDLRPIFDWQSVIRRRCIVYIGLDALSDYEVAGAIGNAMFADLTSVAGELYKFGADGGLPGGGQGKARIAVHADEFNEIIGPAFVPLLNKAGGAGFQVTAYTQTWSDVEARVGSKARAGQVGGNFNTLVMLRVKNTETAQILTDQLPMARIASLVSVSGVTDGDRFGGESFTSKNEDRIQEVETELIEPADLTSLPKGQAFALIEGGKLWKLRLPLASSANDDCMPDSLMDVVRRMRERRGGDLGGVG